MAAGLYKTTIRSLPFVYRGKVRDSYAVGDDKLLIVTTDRLSAFDVVMSQPIPDKGRVLNAMSNFWFEKLQDVIGNHLTGIDPESVVAPDEVDQVRGRAVVALRLKPIPVEAVVRGYLIGSLLLVLLVELLNTAIEVAVDRDSVRIDPLGKRAKDYGSAAVTIVLLIAGMTWVTILGSHYL